MNPMELPNYAKSSAFVAEIVSRLLTVFLPRLESDRLMTVLEGFRAFVLAARSLAKKSATGVFFKLAEEIIKVHLVVLPLCVCYRVASERFFPRNYTQLR